MAIGDACGFNRVYRDIDNPAPFPHQIPNERELMNRAHVVANRFVSDNGSDVPATTDNN